MKDWPSAITAGSCTQAPSPWPVPSDKPGSTIPDLLQPGEIGGSPVPRAQQVVQFSSTSLSGKSQTSQGMLAGKWCCDHSRRSRHLAATDGFWGTLGSLVIRPQLAQDRPAMPCPMSTNPK